MPRPLSDSWQYFTLLDSQDGKSRKARCSFCGLEKAASITRLHQHLLYRCSRIDPKVREQLRQKEDEDNEPRQQHQQQQQQQPPRQRHYSSSSSSPPPPPRPQSTIPLPLPLAPQPQPQPSTKQKSPFIRAEAMPEQAMLDWYLARALYSSNIPFEAIEDPHLIEFFRHLQPNYTVPDSRRLQQYLLKEQHWDLIKRNDRQTSIIEPQQQQQQHYSHHQHQQHYQQQQQQQQQQQHNRMGSSSSSSRMSPEDFEGNL